jgi:hypothetical protein
MNGPFKMKPGRGDMPKTGRSIPTQMKNPLYITGDPTKEKVTEIVDRPTSTVEKSGDVFKGTTTKITTKTPRRVITTPEGDEAYAKLSPEGKKAQDAKFKELENVETTEIKTTGLTKPKKSGPSSDFKVDLGREKERIDPIERIEAFEQRSGTRGHQGVKPDGDFAGPGKYYNRPVKHGAGYHFVDRATKGFGGAMGYEVRGVRKSGEKVDLGLSKNIESFGKFLKSKRSNKK